MLSETPLAAVLPSSPSTCSSSGAGTIVRSSVGDRLFTWRCAPSAARRGGAAASSLEVWETWPAEEPSTRRRCRALRLDAAVLPNGVAVFEGANDAAILCVATARSTQRFLIPRAQSDAIKEAALAYDADGGADAPPATCAAAWTSSRRVAIGRADGSVVVQAYDADVAPGGGAAASACFVSRSGGGLLFGYFSSLVGYGAESGEDSPPVLAVGAAPRASELAARRHQLVFTCAVDGAHSLALSAWSASHAGPPLQRWSLDLGAEELDAGRLGGADVAIGVNDLCAVEGGRAGKATPFVAAIAVPSRGKLFAVRGVATLGGKYAAVAAPGADAVCVAAMPRTFLRTFPVRPVACAVDDCRRVWCLLAQQQQGGGRSGSVVDADDIVAEGARSERVVRMAMTGAALRCWDVVDAHAAGRRAGSGALALRAAPTPALLEREQFAWAEGERAEALPAVALGAAAAAAAAGEEAEAAVATDDGDGDGLDAGAYAAAAALVATNRFWQHRLFSGTRFSDAVIAEALVHYGRRSGAGQAGASKAAAAAGVDDGANPFEYYERAQLEAEAWRAVRAAAERERERYDGAVAAHARAWRQLLRFCAVAWHRAHRPLGLVLPSARAGRRIAGDGATPFVAPLVVRDAGVAVLRPALPVERAALGGDDGVGDEAAHAAGGASPALRALLDVVAMLEARAAPHLLRQCDPLSASTCGIARVDEYHREGAARSDGGGDGGALYAMQTDAHDIFEDDVVLKEWVLRVAQSAAASAGAAARPSTAEHAHFAAERRAEAQARAEAVDVEDCLVAALAAGRSPFSVLEELVAFVEGEEEEVGALRLGAAGAPNATTRVWARSLWQLAAARMRAARGAALALAYIAHCASAAPLRHVLRGVEGGALLAESLALLRRCDTACWLLSRRPDEMARAYALPGCTFYLAALGTDALTPRNVARAGSAQDEFFGPHSLVRSLAESRQISTLAPLLRKLVVAAAPGGDAMKRLVRLEACCQLCLARVELSAGGAAGGTPTGRAAESFARAALLFRQGAPSAGDASLRVPEATKELQVRTSSTAVAAAGSAALAELQLIAAHVARVDAAPRADAGHSAQQWWRESSSALRSSLAGCDARLNAQLRVLASEGKGEDEDEDAVLDGDGDGDAAMAAPPRRADTRLMYYRIVMSLFSSCDQPVHALAFARCAIDATVGGGAAALMQPGQGGGHAAADGGSVVMDLWYEVFKHALTLGQKNDAFNALVQIEDTVQRKDCQSRFILELLDKRSYAWIVDFSFAHWAPHFNERRIAMISRSFDHAVETELEQQALKDFLVEPLRAKDAGSQRGRVFHVLYAWHFKRGDLRKAAEAMYHLAKHLEDDEDKYGRSASVACFVRACVERRVGALLACANAMRLLPSPRLVPYAMKGRVASGSSARDGGSRDDDDGTQLMVTLAGVEREVELALAWLAADAEAERALNGDAKDADAAATAALALELAPLFVPAESGGGACGELCEMVVPAVSGGGAAADGPSVVNVEGSLLALPPHCRTVGRAVRFIYYKKRVGGVPPSEPLRSWLCAQSNALWLDAEHAPAASTAPSSVRRLPSTQNELSKVLVTLMQLLRQEQLPEAFALARAFTPPLPAAGAELALCVTRAAARLCATAGRASVWPALRAELRAIDAATAARASADATAPTSVGGNLSAYAHYLAAAEAALAQDCDVALPQWLVDTLVWSSGHARKAAAAPSADSWASRRRPPAAALIRLFLDKGLLIEACEAATAMLQDAALSRGALSGERFAALPEALLNALLQRCREVLQRTSSHAADYRLRHLNRAHETLLGTFAALPA